MNFASRHVIESAALPGVRFTIRILNEIQRARRDLATMDARARLSSLNSELGALPDPDAKIAQIQAAAADQKRELTGEERSTIAGIEAEACTASARLKRGRLSYEMDLLIATELKPAYIRAGLAAIEGLEIDGQPASVDLLLESGEDALLKEIYEACYAASDLSPEQRKNWLSPSISANRADGGESNMTAGAAPA